MTQDSFKKFQSVLLVLVMVAGGFMFASSASAFASETVKGAKKDLSQFKTEMNTKLEKIEDELKELRANANEKGSDAKKKTVSELEQMRDNLRAKVNDLSEDSGDAWQKFKKGLADSADELNAKIQNALNK